MVAMEDEPSPVMEFWKKFDALREDAGDPPAGRISKLAAEKHDRDVGESTIRGWINDRRLPRDEDDFATVIAVLEAEAALRHPGTKPAQDWTRLLRAAKTTVPIPHVLAGADQPLEIDPPIQQPPSEPAMNPPTTPTASTPGSSPLPSGLFHEVNDAASRNSPTWSRRRMRAIGAGLLVLVLVVAGFCLQRVLKTKYELYADWQVELVAGQCYGDWRTDNRATRSVVDFDEREFAAVEGPPGVGASGNAHDLAYFIDCEPGTPIMLFKRGIATLVGDNPTLQRCEEAVRVQDGQEIPTSPSTPSTRGLVKRIQPRPGMTICTTTNRDAILMLRVRSVATDSTTTVLAATLWK